MQLDALLLLAMRILGLPTLVMLQRKAWHRDCRVRAAATAARAHAHALAGPTAEAALLTHAAAFDVHFAAAPASRDEVPAMQGSPTEVSCASFLACTSTLGDQVVG